MSTTPETPKAECLCAECNRPMRPRGVLRKEMPGTMAWGHSGKCKSCVQPNRTTDLTTAENPAEDAEAAQQEEVRSDFHLAHTISGLNSFMAARRRRIGDNTAAPTAALAAGGRRPPAQAPRAAAPRSRRRAA